MVKSIPDELFEELTKEVTGSKDTKIFTKAQAMTMISRIANITGIAKVAEPEVIDEEDSDIVILSELGY